MNKDNLQKRIDELDGLIEKNISEYKEIVAKKDAFINEATARHNMLLGQKNEITEWLSKLESQSSEQQSSDASGCVIIDV